MRVRVKRAILSRLDSHSRGRSTTRAKTPQESWLPLWRTRLHTLIAAYFPESPLLPPPPPPPPPPSAPPLDTREIPLFRECARITTLPIQVRREERILTNRANPAPLFPSLRKKIWEASFVPYYRPELLALPAPTLSSEKKPTAKQSLLEAPRIAFISHFPNITRDVHTSIDTNEENATEQQAPDPTAKIAWEQRGRHALTTRFPDIPPPVSNPSTLLAEIQQDATKLTLDDRSRRIGGTHIPGTISSDGRRISSLCPACNAAVEHLWHQDWQIGRGITRFSMCPSMDCHLAYYLVVAVNRAPDFSA